MSSSTGSKANVSSPRFVLLATTGMRRGEVIGLRWRDVDFDAGDLAVANTLTTAGSSTVVSGPPKTPRSRRQIFLDDWTLDVLRAHRRAQAAERLSVGPAWNAGEDYVFTDEVGNSLHPDSVSRQFQQAVNRSGLPRIRLHDLRHSYATVALKAGVHPKVVSERLGHATVGVTLDLYSHVTPVDRSTMLRASSPRRSAQSSSACQPVVRLSIRQHSPFAVLDADADLGPCSCRPG